MKLSKSTLANAVNFVATSKDYRPVMENVSIQSTRIESTNGSILYARGHEDGESQLSCLVNANSVKQALKVWPKNVETLDLDLAKSQENGKVYFADDTMPALEKGEGIWPQTDQVRPKDNPCYRVYLDPALVETVGKTLKKTNKVICLEFFQGNGAIRITGDTIECENPEYVLLMPLSDKNRLKAGKLS